MTQSIKNLIRRLNPGISAEQKRFEIIEDLGGEGIVCLLYTSDAADED